MPPIRALTDHPARIAWMAIFVLVALARAASASTCPLASDSVAAGDDEPVVCENCFTCESIVSTHSPQAPDSVCTPKITASLPELPEHRAEPDHATFGASLELLANAPKTSPPA